MRFAGAWIQTSDDGVAVSFDDFDDTELTPGSEWTEAWQNEDPSLPAGFTHPAMILAQTARRLLERRPELAERARSFTAAVDARREPGTPAPTLEIRDAEHLGLLCLRLCDWMEQTTRKRAVNSNAAETPGADAEIPW